MELHRFLVGDGKQWEMAAKVQGGSHFSVSLYFFPSRNPFLALALWIWIFQACAEFGTPWWPAQAVSCGGISPPPSVKFLNCSACLSCSEVWVPGVADGAGAGGMEWRRWLALGNGSSYQPFLFYIFFAMKIFLPLFFHEACWKQLAKNRFAFVYWLLSFCGAWKCGHFLWDERTLRGSSEICPFSAKGKWRNTYLLGSASKSFPGDSLKGSDQLSGGLGWRTPIPLPPVSGQPVNWFMVVAFKQCWLQCIVGHTFYTSAQSR